MLVGSHLGKLLLDRVRETAFPLIIDGVLVAGVVLFLVG